MTWVITRLCQDCLDTSCIEVCPVDCIYEYVGPASDQFPNQLYIDPEECIDCQACEPVCPRVLLSPNFSRSGKMTEPMADGSAPAAAMPPRARRRTASNTHR